ncbi:MAG: hypothetical protein ACJATP_001036 [Candidatus Azotimanducaceae bacterium]|jgi:hypothetical protein
MLNGRLSRNQYEFRLKTINVLRALFTKEGIFFERYAYFFVPLCEICCRVKFDSVRRVQVQWVFA